MAARKPPLPVISRPSRGHGIRVELLPIGATTSHSQWVRLSGIRLRSSRRYCEASSFHVFRSVLERRTMSKPSTSPVR